MLSKEVTNEPKKNNEEEVEETLQWGPLYDVFVI